MAEGPLAHGFNVAVAGYTLAPEATMEGIVREARAALRWLHQNLARLGGDPARLYVGGWSAGGHLTAMLMDEPLVAGVPRSAAFSIWSRSASVISTTSSVSTPKRRAATARC